VLKVLIAEDDLMIADLAEEVLAEAGYEVCGIARTVAEAIALAQHHTPDLAVLDLRLADGGLESGTVWTIKIPVPLPALPIAIAPHAVGAGQQAA
jgi:DNA-binding response OmpR family regulator